MKSERLLQLITIGALGLAVMASPAAYSPGSRTAEVKVHSLGADQETCEFCHAGPGPNTSSQFCMRCHDGSMGPAFHNFSLGCTLSGNHPVSVTLVPGNGYKLPTGNSGVRLFGPGEDQVECLSCHLTHDSGAGLVVRPPDGREVCLQCHEM